jgi:hypothetical protein
MGTSADWFLPMVIFCDVVFKHFRPLFLRRGSRLHGFLMAVNVWFG